MAIREIRFDIQSLLRLMTHYSEGVIPPDAEVRIAGPHKWLNGWWGMVLSSRQWPVGTRMEDPIVFRYEGRKNTVIQGGRGSEVQTQYAPDAPKRSRRI